jgi:hypothetical protein
VVGKDASASNPDHESKRVVNLRHAPAIVSEIFPYSLRCMKEQSGSALVPFELITPCNRKGAPFHDGSSSLSFLIHLRHGPPPSPAATD